VFKVYNLQVSPIHPLQATFSLLRVLFPMLLQERCKTCFTYVRHVLDDLLVMLSLCVCFWEAMIFPNNVVSTFILPRFY
jgi:hypothetical protein